MNDDSIDRASAQMPDVTDEQISVYRDLFVSRLSPFFVQRDYGKYFRVDRCINDGHIRAHLRGSITLGLLVGEDSTTKFALVDIDRGSPDAVTPVWRGFDALGISTITMFSGRKGFHVIVLFDKMTPLAKARSVVRLASGDHEVWPKQSRIVPGQLGNCIKGPFGVHRVTGKRCVAVNRRFEYVEDHWSLIRDLPRTSAEAVLARVPSLSQGHAPRKSASAFVGPATMKPCLARELAHGTEIGRRNEVGFALATELRRLGYAEEKAVDVLGSWNARNRPPLPQREVEGLCVSAYARSRSYEYGCAPDGRLRQFVQCVGTENCAYYQAMMHKSTSGKRAPAGVQVELLDSTRPCVANCGTLSSQSVRGEI